MSSTVHRLVAMAFIPNLKNKIDVNHKDGNRTNNIVSNLEWVSRRENVSHSNKRANRSSKYVGVYRSYNKWVSSICVIGKRTYLGYFNTEIEARNAYLNALNKYGIENKYA